MNPPTDRDRIESLARSGHLSRRDAEKILAALDAIESERAAAEHGPAERTPIVVVGFPRLRVRYALGELSEEAFRTAVRVQWTLLSVVSGLLFAVLMGLTHFFWLGKIAWLAWAIMGVVFGVLSGLVLYYVQIRPQVDKLVEFCREAGRPTRPLSDGRCGQCPCCGAENSTEFSWPHPVVMHWVINPGVAFNEVVLGQRCFRSWRSCRECRTSFVTCPHCEASLDEGVWTGHRSFWNWSGMFCPRCEGEIPTISNALGWLVRTALYPVRRIFLKRQEPRLVNCS